MSQNQINSDQIQDQDPTLHDVLGAINQLSTDMDGKFCEIDVRFKEMDKRFDKLDGKVGHIENVVVTKDYLDEKISDLRGDLVVLVRKEDNKVLQLVNILHKRQVITPEDVESILALELFPKKVKAV